MDTVSEVGAVVIVMFRVISVCTSGINHSRGFADVLILRQNDK